MKIVARDVAPRTVWALEQAGVHPLLARLYAARGVLRQDELDDGLARLLPPARCAARARPRGCWPTPSRGQRASASWPTTTAMAPPPAPWRCAGCGCSARAHVSYLVPDRVVDGYGLTPPIAERVPASGADLLITVDNGIASVEGVAARKALGLKVLVTDHHLPGPSCRRPTCWSTRTSRAAASRARASPASA